MSHEETSTRASGHAASGTVQVRNYRQTDRQNSTRATKMNIIKIGASAVNVINTLSYVDKGFQSETIWLYHKKLPFRIALSDPDLNFSSKAHA